MGVGRVRVARLPATTDRNPYQRLLYGHLAAHDVALVGEGELTTHWLQAHRSEVDLLHIHWRLDRLVDDDQPLGPPRPRTIDQRVRDAAELAHRLRSARQLGYRIAWTVHEIAVVGQEEPTFDHLAAVELGSAADVVLAHNQVTAAHLAALELVPSDRVQVVPLGHYAHAHPAGEQPTRADLGIAPTATVLLAFGHHRPDKEHDALAAALRQVDRDDLVLVVAGAGVDAAGWADELAAGRVRVLGEVPDDEVVALHRLADATVSARSYEWTPSSLVLSLSLGVPVIAADLASVAEHGGPGVFPFRPGSPSDLAATMARVADDPRGRHLRGRAGEAFVRQVSWDDSASATAAAFRRAIDDPRPPSS